MCEKIEMGKKDLLVHKGDELVPSWNANTIKREREIERESIIHSYPFITRPFPCRKNN